MTRAGYAAFVRRRAGLILLSTAVVTAIAGVLAARLTISTDFAALLPRGYASVEDLHKLLKRVGGSALLTVVVESPDPRANERFADALAARLRDDLGDELVHLDYKVDALRRFYERHAAVYLPLDDLRAIERDLDRAKLRASPLPYDLDLSDDDKTDPLDQVDQRIKDASKAFARYPNGYFAGDGLLAMFLRPRSSSADTEVARAFIARVRRSVDAVGPARYHPSLRVAFTGAYQIALDEHAAISHDLASTAVLCIALIALAVTLYFRRLRVIVLLGLTLVCGCAWAFALARLAVGFLNVQTAFLGSIIAGTGINYGIILTARYLEERRRGRSEGPALEAALGDTFVATLAAAATTAISFGTLFIARISSFRHFAIIGGGGILFCWILSFTFLPALLVVSDRLNPVVSGRGREIEWPALLVALPLRWPRLVAGASLVLALAGAAAFLRFAPSLLETDGRNLRNKSSQTSGAALLDERVSKLRGESMTPSFVVTDSLEESRRVCEVLNARVLRDGARAPLSGCRSLHSLLPEDQEAKLAIARRLADKLELLPPAQRARFPRDKFDLEPVTLASLPEELQRPFREVSGG
jgi:predicted exporter